MIIVGEKINGTRKAVKEAIINRDKEYIKGIVFEQVNAGTDYLDVNAGTNPDREAEDMIWLIDVVQDATEIPICIDSSSSETLKLALDHVNHQPMVNSINADPQRLASFLSLISKKACPVIALALDESKSGMPKDNEERLVNIAQIFEATREAHIPDELIFVDPLIMSVSTDINAGVEVLACMQAIKKEYPKAHITGGLSNISFGLPFRELVNRTFLTLAMASGMDSAVCNPANRALIESLKATEMLLGKDRFCRRYTLAAKNEFASK